MTVTIYQSLITLNVSGLNAPIKRHKVTEWLRKQDSYTCCLLETPFSSKDKHRLKSRVMEKDIS